MNELFPGGKPESVESFLDVIFNGLEYMNKCPGFVCFSFPGINLINYTQTSGITNTFGMAVGGYVTNKYQKYLRDKVAFLVEDMPALALSLPRNTPIRVTDLHSSYVSNEGVKVSGLTAMAVAGKDLVRTPVMKVEFGENDGSLILSQLITQGRLAPGYAPWRRVRPLEFDPAAVTFVLNMIDNSLK